MWNHNTHFHRYLLRQLPRKIHLSLDVGCGLGLFTGKLAKRSNVVDAIDINDTILKEASNRNTAPNIRYLHADFIEANLPKDSYDAIVSIASLHHLNLEAALEKMKVLLRSSGKLVILGLYKQMTILDYIYSAISVPINLIYLNWYRESIAIPTVTAPIYPPQLSLKQIKAMANIMIPGFNLKRHLFWRYSLIWQNPKLK